MAHMDQKSPIGRMDLNKIGQAIEGRFMETIDVPVILVIFDSKKGEVNPTPTFPNYHRQKDDKFGSIIVSTRVHEFLKSNQLSDENPIGKKFRTERKIARMTISDIEAHVIQQQPEFLDEIIKNFNTPVIRRNERSGLPVTLRTNNLKTFIELLEPDPENPERAKAPEVEPVPAGTDKDASPLKKGK